MRPPAEMPIETEITTAAVKSVGIGSDETGKASKQSSPK